MLLERHPTDKEERMGKVGEFSKKVLESYGERVKCIVVVGSTARGDFKLNSDTDVLIVIDDTDEASEKIDEMSKNLEEIAKKVSGDISVQFYTLTSFWDYARIGHPILYNFIKDGIPIHDNGFFAPIKRLLKHGKIPNTREAAENHMDSAFKCILRAENVKLLMLAEDCYHAMLDSTLAVLMSMGLEPPAPRKIYDTVKEALVEPGILEPKYAEWLREIIEIRKRIVYKELKDVTGAFVDEWIAKSEEFLNKMFSIFNCLELIKRKKVLERTYEVMLEAVITALNTLGKMPEKEEGVFTAFKREFVDSGFIDSHYVEIWTKIENMKKLADEGKIAEIPEEDVYKMRGYVKKLINKLSKVLEKVNGEE